VEKLMPRYEIVVHIASEMDCQTAEEAAAIVRRQIMSNSTAPRQLLHLAVWHDARGGTPSPVDPVIRDKLVDFFRTLEQRAAEAEETFRGQVEAILMGAVSSADGTAAAGASRPEHPQVNEHREPS
jgi:hypothetical protein